jgi:hypothetical protein
MNDLERAEQHLRTIRRLMERGTIYRAISAPTALVGGLLSLILSALLLTGHAPNFGDYSFVVCWLVVLLLTSGANTYFIVAGAKNRNEPVISASMKTALASLAPPYLAAAAITAVAVAFRSNSFDENFLPLIWTIFYGLGLLATFTFAPRSLVLLGWAFLLTGLLAFIYGFSGIGSEPPDHFGTCLMAATFGLYHLIYALCAWPRKNAEPEP